MRITIEQKDQTDQGRGIAASVIEIDDMLIDMANNPAAYVTPMILAALSEVMEKTR